MSTPLRHVEFSLGSAIRSGRLIGLLEMIYFSLHYFQWAIKLIDQEIQHCRWQGSMGDRRVTLDREYCGRIVKNLGLAEKVAKDLLLESALGRLEKIHLGLRGRGALYSELATDLQTLKELIEHEIQFRDFRHIPRQKALALASVEGEWADCLKAFPSATRDVRSAAEAFAYGLNDACAFHLMRVLEYGLASLAAAVGKTYDRQQWHNIIEEIEAGIAAKRRGTNSVQKQDELRFYSEAAKEFFYFKDGWRNHVSHNRTEYDEPQAQSLLAHVRSFMNHLSSRLSEVP